MNSYCVICVAAGGKEETGISAMLGNSLANFDGW